MDLLGHHRRRRIRPHATGVRAGIAVADPFVILRGRHPPIPLVAAHDAETRLFTIEKILHHAALTSLATHRADYQHPYRGLGLPAGFRTQEPLAPRPTHR